MRFATQTVLSILSGFFLMVPLAEIFETMRWPMFHGWALAHGSFLIAWPALTIVAFVGLSLVPAFRRDFRDDLALGLAGLVGFGILTTTEWPGRAGPRVPYLLAIAFGTSAALCVVARRPWRVPLAMTVPLLLINTMGPTTVWVGICAFMGLVAVPVIRWLGWRPSGSESSS